MIRTKQTHVLQMKGRTTQLSFHVVRVCDRLQLQSFRLTSGNSRTDSSRIINFSMEDFEDFTCLQSHVNDEAWPVRKKECHLEGEWCNDSFIPLITDSGGVLIDLPSLEEHAIISDLMFTIRLTP